MYKIKFLLLSFLVLFLTGCSYLGDNNKVSVPRTQGKNNPPIKTPPGMDVSFNTLYPIPHKAYPQDVKQVNISPPGLYANKNPGNTA